MYCSYRARIDAHYADRKQSVSASEAFSAVRQLDSFLSIFTSSFTYNFYIAIQTF